MNTYLRQALPACLLAVAALGAGLAQAAAASPATTGSSALPTDSIYQLPLTFTDQDGRDFSLAEHRGKPVLVSMFYTSCQFVCPMLIDAIRSNEAELSAPDRAQLSVVLVSFDPVHDSVTVLKRTAGERHLDAAHWSLARTDTKSVRKLAALLGVQYRQLPNGDFNHSTVIALIDREGRIAAKTVKLGDVDTEFVKQMKNVAGQGPAQ
ncbi:MAG: SCO family protein [Rhizobacter sp.]